MTALGAYTALVSFPAIAILWQEPVAAAWGFRHGRRGIHAPPLPAELRERSERNYRRLLLLKYAALCGCTYFFVHRYSVPTPSLGLRTQHWLIFADLGTATALACSGCVRLLGLAARSLAQGAMRQPAERQPVAGPRGPDATQQGSAVLWIFGDVLGCFAQEYWRAFCLVSFEAVYRGAALPLVLTSVAFALAHFRGREPASYEVGRLASQATFGMVFAVLFFRPVPLCRCIQRTCWGTWLRCTAQGRGNR